ncbi:leucine-rich repeat protein [Ruminococcus sp. 210702-SL.1.03]|uniref:leucine-rich repeat protein n=1 Tax=Ruminococcus sp. 210702-SL.1.03 TaxID=2883233 RepID=UPI001D05FD4C|nr:leucine-rich repeat protein [Ruminococcus sp. 210702-SL.1.03]MCB6615941.1 leucine-rich repeat protein [Ruminococcus sp. 210702-SL.1.03]
MEYDKEGHRFYIPDSSSSEYTEEELKAKLLSDLDSAYGTEDGWVIKKWIYGDLFQNENKVAIALVADKETDNRYMGYFVSATNTQLLVDEKSKEQLNDFDTFYTDNSVFVTCFYGKTNNHDSSYLFIKKYDGDSMTKTVVYDTKVNEISLEEGKFTKEGDDFYWYWYSSDGSCNKYNVRFNDALGYFWISDEKPVNDYTYTENEDGTVTITSYTGDAEELVIPGEIDGKTVSAIGSGIFSPLNGGNKTIKKITVPASVKTIGEEAFACADALEEVYIEDGVTEIGNSAFASCINLKKITIPKSVTKIGDYAFSYAYRSDSSAFIDVTIYCYKDSTAHKYALGENALNHEFAYVLLDEVSNPDPSSDSTVSADPSSTESGASSGSTSTSTSSAAASSSGDKTSNPATGVAAGVSIAAVLAGGIIMVTKKTKK